MSVTLDLDLMSTALRFWSKGLNSFLFFFSPASITMRDISILTMLPIEGSEAVCLLDVHNPSLPHLEVSSTSQTFYSSTIWKWQTFTRVPSTTKHIEFLRVLCRFVFFPIQVSLRWSIFLWLGPFPLGDSILWVPFSWPPYTGPWASM